MRHMRVISRGTPGLAQDLTVGAILTIVTSLLSVIANFFLSKETTTTTTSSE